MRKMCCVAAALLIILILLPASGRSQSGTPATQPGATVTAPGQQLPAAPPTSTDARPAADIQPPGLVSTEIYNASFKVVFVLFVLAVLIESGLAVLFNWRPFQDFFDPRSVKTLVALVFSYLFVEAFDFDAITRLVNVYAGTSYPVNLPGKIVTALVLAGGSSGVNNLMIALGFRKAAAPREETPRPPPTEAWIAVKLIRRQAKGPVTVRIGTDPDALSVAGTISGSAILGGRLTGYFLRDRGRFPTSGGYRVAAGATYKVTLEGVTSANAPVPPGPGATWGPYPLAPGAVIDLELSL